MKIKLIEKRTGLPRRLDAIFFGADGSPNLVRTLDPDTGHDPWDNCPDDFQWNFNVEDEDIKNWKIMGGEE